jgi:glucosyl-dolichyl phosphate glucuronosyltransferase
MSGLFSPAADATEVGAPAAISGGGAGAVRQGTCLVSVVVCAYTLNRWDDLAAAVQSLQQQSRPPAEIIIVSDHNPRLYTRVAAVWPDVVALENEERQGLSGARNTGVRAARGEIIAFMDDDAVAERDWLRQLVVAYDDPSVLGVGGAILPHWDLRRPGWFPEEFDWVVGCTYKGMPLARARQRNLIGANMSFRRELFAAAGDFQTDMGRIGTRPLGCEETELCIRGAQRLPGTQYVYEPLAKVSHRVPASRSTWRYFVSRCYAEGLSKAQVSDRVGSDAGLTSERQYATRTLPAGFLQGLTDALVHGQVSGLGRAAAIAAGLAITAFGYVHGRLMLRAPSFSGMKEGTAETSADGKAHAEAT